MRFIIVAKLFFPCKNKYCNLTGNVLSLGIVSELRAYYPIEREGVRTKRHPFFMVNSGFCFHELASSLYTLGLTLG